MAFPIRTRGASALITGTHRLRARLKSEWGSCFRGKGRMARREEGSRSRGTGMLGSRPRLREQRQNPSPQDPNHFSDGLSRHLIADPGMRCSALWWKPA